MPSYAKANRPSCKRHICTHFGRVPSLTYHPLYRHKATTGQANLNRQAAGTNAQPFKFPTRYNVTRPDGLHVSAEEYPFASTREGGTGANLFPVTVAMQNSTFCPRSPAST